MPFFIDVFHGFYRTAIVPTFIDIVPFLINIVPTNNLFLIVGGELIDPKLPKTKKSQCYQTFLGAVLCIKAGENFEFGER